MRVRRNEEGKRNKSLHAFNRGNGKITWKIDFPEGVAMRGAPILFSHNKKALIPISTGNILVIDIKKGEIIKEIEIGTITTNVVVVRGKDIGIGKK